MEKKERRPREEQFNFDLEKTVALMRTPFHGTALLPKSRMATTGVDLHVGSVDARKLHAERAQHPVGLMMIFNFMPMPTMTRNSFESTLLYEGAAYRMR